MTHDLVTYGGPTENGSVIGAFPSESTGPKTSNSS